MNSRARRHGSPEDTIIALMGPSRSGKSTFMHTATVQNLNIKMDGLQSRKSPIRALEVFHPTTGERLVLVDTPGLDDTKLDLQFLKMMTSWLRKNHNNCRVAGIVYMHRLADGRCLGSPQNNALLFDTLCRNESKNSVVIATTMWQQIRENVPTKKEKEHSKNLWREMLRSGARIMRFHGSFASAWEIIDIVLKSRCSSPASPTPGIEIDGTHLHMTFDELDPEPGVRRLPKSKTIHRNRSAPRHMCKEHSASIDNLPEKTRPRYIDPPGENKISVIDSWEIRRGFKPQGNHGGAIKYFEGPLNGYHEAVVAPTTIEDLSRDEVVIALMGMTGAGKSSFIRAATGYEGGVGHQLQSCTNDVNLIKFKCNERNKVNIVFVDTPALDHTNKSYPDVLDVIARCLKKLKERNTPLRGVLYFHRITDHATRSMCSDLAVFGTLCRNQSLKNIIFVTTMWDQIDEEKGSQAERQLKDKYFKGMTDQGATVMRYDGTSDTTWDIIGKLYARC